MSSASATSAFLISSSANGSREGNVPWRIVVSCDSTAMFMASRELDFDRVPVAEPGATIRRHDGGAVEFLDQQRTVSPLGTDRTAEAHRGFDRTKFGAEVSSTGSVGACTLMIQCKAIGNPGRCRGSTSDHAQAHCFHCLCIGSVAVLPLVRFTEQPPENRGDILIGGAGQCQLGIGTGIPQVDESLE